MIHADSRIAVIGGGISGLASAWLLDKRHQVTLFERNHYVGGHSNTLMVDGPRGPVPVDTGFVVFNEHNYPELTSLFRHLGVASQDTDMSFSASIGDGRMEYAGTNLNTLFAQRGNLVRPRFLRMVRDILRFNRHGKELLETHWVPDVSLGDYLFTEGYGAGFRDDYLLPMAAAIWSCPTRQMLDFPLISFLNFFRNHGLLNVTDRPQWRTVTGGSRVYVRRMLDTFNGDVHTGSPVVQVRRRPDGVQVRCADGRVERFDQVVMASHADETLSLIENPSEAERQVLGAFRYQPNRTLLHTDARLMPKRRAVWSSWNYLARDFGDGGPQVSVTYWMNRLHRLPENEGPYLVSLNPLTEPREETIIREMTYQHPVFDAAAMAAQKRVPGIQGADRLWFCGAWCGYGFHEDGLKSAETVAWRLGVSPPWLGESREPAHIQTRPDRVAAA
ncbi:amine oxidase [Thioalkalivibrio sulfidiphilus HL-EbGr7]|uniref:Amine oxidase n=1 Tax=Thioalkalivibrio sulfidiphilus (strain HL-EbGR7) TaxID=396588 RepID=B8GR55_THISH|nr:FAD-dependent oxidoreductase [Thioalkalivibrio sulfidiphilus]ACL72475.1 amine oxidase [Thioalkalivibrio sulfidiphilus HL-EbGr7]